MTPEQFVHGLREEIIPQLVTDYTEQIAAGPTPDTDPNGRVLMALHDKLTPAERAVVLAALRQVVIDTVATMLGLLDGSSVLDDFRDDYSLTYGKGRKKLNGDLLDLFLAEGEENP